MIRKIAIRLIILSIILSGLDLIYKWVFYPSDLESTSKEILELQRTQESTDIYYFGESSNVTYRPEDSLKNSISEFISWFYPGLKITNINKYATHAGVYRQWLKVFDEDKELPLAVIVTMNLRSFNAAWIHSDLETQLQQSLVFAQPYPPLINRFLLSLQAFDNKTKEQREHEMLEEWRTKQLEFPYPFRYSTVSQWDNAMAQGGYLKEDGSWNMEKIVLACHYIKGYAFNIDEHHPRIQDFDAINDWCRKKGVRLYLNLMAENIQYADSLVGKDLVFLMRQNRDYLVQRYNRGNTRVIDNLERVKGYDFIDQNWTTEHYGYEGRMIIAKNVADSLKKEFNNNYKAAY